MSSADDPGWDWMSVVTIALVFVLVASAAGTGTYATLRDYENTTAQATLNVEATISSGTVKVDRVQCTPKIESDDGTQMQYEDATVIHSEDVGDADRCARISFYLASSLLESKNAEPESAFIIHKHENKWWKLDTAYSQTDGLARFTAYTDKFSPFAVAVPNESQPPVTVQAPNQTTNVSNSTVGNGTVSTATTQNNTTSATSNISTPTPTPTPAPDEGTTDEGDKGSDEGTDEDDESDGGTDEGGDEDDGGADEGGNGDAGSGGGGSGGNGDAGSGGGGSGGSGGGGGNGNGNGSGGGN